MEQWERIFLTEERQEILRVFQSITFGENSSSGIFAKGEKVYFNGYLQRRIRLYEGYMRQETENGNGVLLYVRGMRQNNGDLILLGFTNKNRPDIPPICLCSYFYKFKNEGSGYLDDTDGIPTIRNSYFFRHGEYIAKPYMIMEKVEHCSENYQVYYSAERKVRRMIGKMEEIKGKENLYLGCLFDALSPYHQGIMAEYPAR